MFQLIVEKQFEQDYRQVIRRHPRLKGEYEAAFRELRQTGTLSAGYRLHLLGNPGGAYSNHMEFHLSDGKIDVLAIYMPHKSNPSIRLVRTGSHEDLFEGPEL